VNKYGKVMLLIAGVLILIIVYQRFDINKQARIITYMSERYKIKASECVSKPTEMKSNLQRDQDDAIDFLREHEKERAKLCSRNIRPALNCGPLDLSIYD